MSNRIQVIDILRGMTLFGIILVNTTTINGPFFLNEIDFAFIFSIYDVILAEIIAVALLEKSYPIFVLLFGIGTKLLLQALLKKYQSDRAVFMIFFKRMIVLGIFGFLHGALFYWGDVLLMYAVLGLIAGSLLIFVFKDNYRAMLKFNLVLVFLSFLITIGMHVAIYYDQHHSDFEAHFVDTLSNNADDSYDAIPEDKKELEEDIDPNNALYNPIYQDGNVQAIVQNNLNSYFKSYLSGLFSPLDLIIALKNINYLLEVFIVIIFGMIAAAVPIWNDKIMNLEQKTILKFITLLSMPFILSECLVVVIPELGDYVELFSVFLLMNNIVLYLLIFLLMYNKLQSHDRYRIMLRSFAAMGSMTLTWYLLQSLIMGLLLFNYAFGLYGKVGISECFIFSVGYYLLCYKVSPWWVDKYQHGPVEKFWRWLTMPKNNSPDTSRTRCLD